MPIKIFNTLSGKKELLPQTKSLKLFVCGPTVYDYPHIGNARTYLAFDIIIRYIRTTGIKVFYLQNITDIDDKIINRAREEHTTAKKIALAYEKIYHANEKALGITSITKYARATAYIKEIVAQVQTLLKKGYAYKTDDGYYFNLSQFSDYGKLSKRTTEQANDAISRIDEGVHKRNKGDFVLWKFKKNVDEPSWKTPLGEGRPGWHIEDTAISEKFFGPQYDLHGGAVDLKFPHHEAEIAQQESASGKKPFVRFWMHTGFLLVNGQKMSKSLKNFTSITDFLKKYSSELFRYIVASHHYRSSIDFNDTLVLQARQSLFRITGFLARLSLMKKSGSLTKSTTSLITQTKKRFSNAMADDFNTPLALATIFELINAIEPRMWSLTKQEAESLRIFIIKTFSSLGFTFKKSPQIPSSVKTLIKKRELCRIHKQFTQSDALRKKIEELGYIIEDTPVGPLTLSNK